ncbi:MAG: hypothetical protein R3Y46_07865 [Opitutales bacterium]
MKNFRISILLMLSLLSDCASYNDVKVIATKQKSHLLLAMY